MDPLCTHKDDAPRRRSKQRKKARARAALVRVRLETEERAAWIVCAEAEGYLSLSDWIRDGCNARARQRPMLSSAADGWCTPPEVLAYVRELYGTIGLDPCSNGSSVVEARTAWDTVANGLDRSWIGKGSVFVNPPYGDELPRWINKCRQEAAEGVEVLALVPSRTDTQWFRSVLASACVVGLWRGRIKFLGAPNAAPFPNVAIYWGPRSDEFVRTFGEVCNGFLRGDAPDDPRAT
jgi:hypothetical protein